MKHNNQQGFSVVEVVLVVAIVAILGVVGWYVLDQRNESDSAGTSTPTTQQNEAEVPEINNADDLAESEQLLEETDIDSQLNTNEIDDTLNQ